MYEQIISRKQDKKIISRKKDINRTGIPDAMKERAEQISGCSMDDVRVHRNSNLPVQMGALAYAQGSNIYLGAGQESHLSHELGHVVQQMQGRVQATGSINGQPLNDNAELEREADRMFL